MVDLGDGHKLVINPISGKAIHVRGGGKAASEPWDDDQTVNALADDILVNRFGLTEPGAATQEQFNEATVQARRSLFEETQKRQRAMFYARQGGGDPVGQTGPAQSAGSGLGDFGALMEANPGAPRVVKEFVVQSFRNGLLTNPDRAIEVADRYGVKAERRQGAEGLPFDQGWLFTDQKTGAPLTQSQAESLMMANVMNVQVEPYREN